MGLSTHRTEEHSVEKGTTVAKDQVPAFPDGCRDVPVIKRPGRRTFVIPTPFDLRPRSVVLPQATFMSGDRLHPEAAVDERVLDAMAANPGAARDLTAGQARQGLAIFRGLSGE